MAQLTWRNVDEPDLTRASSILNTAVQGFTGAGDGVASLVGDIRDRQRRDRSAAAIPILAGISSSQGVGAALGQVGQIIDPRDMTPELQQALLGAQATGLGLDQTRAQIGATQANTSSILGAEGRAQTNFDRGIMREDQEAAAAAGLVRAREGAYAPPVGVGEGSTPASGALAATAGPPLTDREMLARTLQAEAGSQGLDGMVAVGAVIANRTGTGRWGGTVRDVIMAPGQFSAWNSVTGYAGGEQGQDMLAMRPTDNAYAAADAILSGNYADPTGGATHYYNPDAGTGEPAWGQNSGGNWSRIGAHVFGTPAGEAGSNGSGGAPRISVADLIPENNMLPASFWTGQVDDNYNASEVASQDRDADRARDYDFARTSEMDSRNDTVYAREEETYRIAQEAVERTYEILPATASMAERLNVVTNMEGLSGREREAAIAALRAFTDANPEYDTPLSTPPVDQQSELIGEQMSANATFNDVTDPGRSAVRRVTGSDAGTSAPATGGEGEAAAGGTGGSGGGSTGGDTVASVVANILSTTIGEDEEVVGSTANDMVTRINSVAQELGIDPVVVARESANALIGNVGGSGRIFIDEEMLRERLAPFASQDNYQAVVGQMAVEAQRRAEFQTVVGQMAEAQRTIALYSSRSGPGAAAKVAEAQQTYEALLARRDQIALEDNAANGVAQGSSQGSNAPPEQEAPAQTGPALGEGATSAPALGGTPAGDRLRNMAEDVSGLVSTDMPVRGRREAATRPEIPSEDRVPYRTGAEETLARMAGTFSQATTGRRESDYAQSPADTVARSDATSAPERRVGMVSGQLQRAAQETMAQIGPQSTATDVALARQQARIMADAAEYFAQPHIQALAERDPDFLARLEADPLGLYLQIIQSRRVGAPAQP